jgi:predicted nucleotidyltransferase
MRVLSGSPTRLYCIRPMPADGPTLIPLPTHLEPLARTVRAWAQGHQLILRVLLYGSVLKGTARADSDLDLAVEIGPSELSGIARFFRLRDPWVVELRDLTNRQIDLQFADPEFPNVWRYLHEGCALVFERE